MKSGIKSNTETYKDFPDLLDHSKSLCKRTRYARLRAGVADWWQSQLEQAVDEQDQMFALLVLLTWGSSNTTASLAELIDSIINQLSTNNWQRLIRSLRQTIVTLHKDLENTRSTISTDKFLGNLSVKTVTALGMRASSDDALNLYKRHLLDYQGSDAAILLFCQSMAFDLARTDPNYWQESLTVIAHSYAHGIISNPATNLMLSQSLLEGSFFPPDIALEIAQHPERYPRSLTLLTEPLFKKIVDSQIIPIGNIAKEQHWFED